MMRRIAIGIAALLVLAWGAYALFFKPADIPLPPAKALLAEQSVLQALYGYDVGGFTVQSNHAVRLEVGDKALDLSTYYPEGGGVFPLLLFSHGNFSDRRQYDRLIHHWVSHGYIVIAPDHLDAGGMVAGITAMMIHGQDGVLRERPKDMSFVLDNISEIEALVPALSGRIDMDKIAATGHSFGAFVAQMMGGAIGFDPDDASLITGSDTRIKAVLAISPPGPMFDMITEQSWDVMTLPQMVTTGTWDVEPRFFPQWQLHAMSYDKAPMGDNYLIVTEGADHYLGNLICRLDRDVAPQHAALAMLKTSTTAFLDAYVKEDARAKAFLNSDTLSTTTDGFSVLSSR